MPISSPPWPSAHLDGPIRPRTETGHDASLPVPARTPKLDEDHARTPVCAGSPARLNARSSKPGAEPGCEVFVPMGSLVVALVVLFVYLFIRLLAKLARG